MIAPRQSPPASPQADADPAVIPPHAPRSGRVPLTVNELDWTVEANPHLRALAIASLCALLRLLDTLPPPDGDATVRRIGALLTFDVRSIGRHGASAEECFPALARLVKTTLALGPRAAHEHAVTFSDLFLGLGRHPRAAVAAAVRRSLLVVADPATLLVTG